MTLLDEDRDNDICSEIERNSEAQSMLTSIGIINNNDLINRPKHYTLPRAASDCFSVMQQIGMLNNHCLATAFQYLWRAQLKNQYISDLKKARWFIDKAIDEHEAKERSRGTYK